jgi:hypothetical protein
VIKVVSMFITQEEISPDDRNIIESAMDLWSTLLQEQGAKESQDQKSMLDSEFIINGLLNCKCGHVRSCFHSTFKKISEVQASLRTPLIEILLQQVQDIE